MGERDTHTKEDKWNTRGKRQCSTWGCYCCVWLSRSLLAVVATVSVCSSQFHSLSSSPFVVLIATGRRLALFCLSPLPLLPTPVRILRWLLNHKGGVGVKEGEKGVGVFGKRDKGTRPQAQSLKLPYPKPPTLVSLPSSRPNREGRFTLYTPNAQHVSLYSF